VAIVIAAAVVVVEEAGIITFAETTTEKWRRPIRGSKATTMRLALFQKKKRTSFGLQ
jgi:hypothetical protein